jgi:hypothetical protein
MAKLTTSDAARACRVARSTLQRAVNAGRLSLDADHRIDTDERMRAGYTLPAARQDDDRCVLQKTLRDAAPRLHGDAAGAREHDARENAKAAREERVLLLRMLQEMQQ